jgi:hypothetical protein
MPLVLSGILLVFQNKYLQGFTLTALAMALEINASHPQMTYYLLFMILIFGIVYLIDSVKNKDLPRYFKRIGILLVAVVLAVGVNATSLMATKEYAAYSTRSKSELTINPDGSPKEQSTGLSKDYITEYSYGILETFDLFIPRFMGGSNNENLGKDSHIYRFLKDKAGRKQASGFAENAPMYWGEQPIVAAPAYIGSLMIFLFIMGIFLVKGKLKNWLVAATVFSILMSWGKNFDFLTDLFIDYVPLYNKFRAVSSIQVIAELAIPLLAILGMQKFLDKSIKVDDKINALKKSALIIGGLALLFTISGTYLFSFESYRDPRFENMLKGFSSVLVEDRRVLFFQDSLRTLLFVVFFTLTLWLFIKDKINRNVLLGVFLVFVLIDMVGIAKRYVNDDDFISAKKLEQPFVLGEMDAQIRKDKGHYRVLNLTVGTMNDGSTSFFHNSIGGYHAAKPRRYQELYDFQIARNNIDVLNMLNTKYIIFPDDKNQASAQLNDEANGNAWFVHEIKFVENADEEIKALDSLETKNIVIVNKEFQKEIDNFTFQQDSTASIKLVHYQANALSYESNSKVDQIAVFSEMYYKNGWNAYIDGELSPHFRADYVLRSLKIPKGKHKIEFKFEPEVIKKGNTITLISYAFLILIPLGWFFKERKSNV